MKSGSTTGVAKRIREEENVKQCIHSLIKSDGCKEFKSSIRNYA